MRTGGVVAGTILAIGLLLVLVAVELGVLALLLAIPPIGDFVFEAGPGTRRVIYPVIVITMIATLYPAYTHAERRLLNRTDR